MVFKRALIIAISYVCLIVSGCAPKTYIYNGIVYTDPEKALQAQRTLSDDDMREMNISPLSEPLAGKGLVVLPDNKLIWTQMRGPKESWSERQREYMITSRELSLDWHVRLIRERRIFGQTEVQRSNIPEKVPIGNYDALVYQSSNGLQWLLKTRNQNKPEPIHMSAAAKTGVERSWSWLINLEGVLKGQ